VCGGDGIIEFMQAFTKAFASVGLDIHSGNWMVKGDKLYLIDPLAYGVKASKTKSIRIRNTKSNITGKTEVRVIDDIRRAA
jgi:hypothetical protein